MKRSMFGAVMALVLALAANVAFAQSKSTTASVPFAFTVNDSAMPAGHYTITEVSDRVLQIRNDDTNKSMTIIAQREESVKPQKSELVFHRYGDRYVLAEVWSDSAGRNGEGIQLSASKLEQEMRAASKDAGGPAEVVVALR